VFAAGDLPESFPLCMGSLQRSTDSVGGFEGEGKGETEEKGGGN